MPDGFAGHVVLCELVQQLAGKNEIKKIVHVRYERRVGGRLPRATPKKCEDLCIRQQWAVAVGEFRVRGGDDPEQCEAAQCAADADTRCPNAADLAISCERLVGP